MISIKEELKKQARLELSRRDFFEYCKLTASDFYKEDRKFLRDVCFQLQNFYESDEKVCVINMRFIKFICKVSKRYNSFGENVRYFSI